MKGHTCTVEKFHPSDCKILLKKTFVGERDDDGIILIETVKLRMPALNCNHGSYKKSAVDCVQYIEAGIRRLKDRELKSWKTHPSYHRAVITEMTESRNYFEV